MGIYLETLILEVGIGYEINKAVGGLLLFIVPKLTGETPGHGYISRNIDS
jgi:hypothetical protein